MNISSEQKELIPKLMKMKHLFLLIVQFDLGNTVLTVLAVQSLESKITPQKCQLTMQYYFLMLYPRAYMKMIANVPIN